MLNKERFFWVAAVIFLVLNYSNQSNKILDLEIAVAHNTDFETLNLKRRVFYKMLLDSTNEQNKPKGQYGKSLIKSLENEN